MSVRETESLSCPRSNASGMTPQSQGREHRLQGVARNFSSTSSVLQHHSPRSEPQRPTQLPRHANDGCWGWPVSVVDGAKLLGRSLFELGRASSRRAVPSAVGPSVPELRSLDTGRDQGPAGFRTAPNELPRDVVDINLKDRPELSCIPPRSRRYFRCPFDGNVLSFLCDPGVKPYGRSKPSKPGTSHRFAPI